MGLWTTSEIRATQNPLPQPSQSAHVSISCLSGVIHWAKPTGVDVARFGVVGRSYFGRLAESDERRHEAEIVVELIAGLASPGGRVFYQTHFFPLLKLQGEVEEVYLSLRAKTGEEVPFLVNASRAERSGRWENDCVLMRMRQRNQFESELLTAKKAAENANKAKDQFLAALSHELRTPLSPVLMMATAMELDPALPVEQLVVCVADHRGDPRAVGVEG